MLNCELVGYIQFIIDIAFIGKLKFYVLAIICTQQHPFERYQLQHCKTWKVEGKKNNNVYNTKKNIFALV